MHLSIIAAVAENGVIGRGGALPWRLSADLRRFKSLTTGHPIIMGRRTWESLGRPLPGRTSVVVTRQQDYAIRFEEVRLAGDLPEARRIAAESPGNDEAFVIGGSELFAEALPSADRLYLTRVHSSVEGDVWFPQLDWHAWRRVSGESHNADEKNEFDYSFEVYERTDP